MRGQVVDRQALHEQLWKNVDKFGKVEVYQKDLAQRLGITQATMSLVIKDLVTEGRMKKVSSRAKNVGVYVIRDPAVFEHEFRPVSVPGFGIERCELCGAILEVGPHRRRI